MAAWLASNRQVQPRTLHGVIGCGVTFLRFVLHMHASVCGLRSVGDLEPIAKLRSRLEEWSSRYNTVRTSHVFMVSLLVISRRVVTRCCSEILD